MIGEHGSGAMGPMVLQAYITTVYDAPGVEEVSVDSADGPVSMRIEGVGAGSLRDEVTRLLRSPRELSCIKPLALSHAILGPAAADAAGTQDGNLSSWLHVVAMPMLYRVCGYIHVFGCIQSGLFRDASECLDAAGAAVGRGVPIGTVSQPHVINTALFDLADMASGLFCQVPEGLFRFLSSPLPAHSGSAVPALTIFMYLATMAHTLPNDPSGAIRALIASAVLKPRSWVAILGLLTTLPASICTPPSVTRTVLKATAKPLCLMAMPFLTGKRDPLFVLLEDATHAMHAPSPLSHEVWARLFTASQGVPWEVTLGTPRLSLHAVYRFFSGNDRYFGMSDAEILHNFHRFYTSPPAG